MAKAAAAPSTTIQLPRFDLRRATITLVGDTSLITHAWSEKAKKEMRDKQMKVPKEAKSAKDPMQDFLDSMYAFPTGGYGFPIVAFKTAAVDACSHVDGITKVEARGAFHIGLGIKTHEFLSSELVKIHSDEPVMREDMVRVGMGTADLRYRGEFHNWRVTFPIRFNASLLSIDQIFHLFNIAGFGIGVGEWRTQKDGMHGMFHVASGDE